MALFPLDVVIIGTALESRGFIGNQTVSGLGLVTFGFLWPCDGIWMPTDDSTLTTTWVSASIPSQTVEVCQDDNGGKFA